MAVHFGEETNVITFDAQIEFSRPLKVEARQIDIQKKSTIAISVTDIKLSKLGDKTLKALIESKASSLEVTPTVLLSSSVTSNSGELGSYLAGILNSSAWFISAEGEIDSLKYASILKSNKLVNIKGVASSLNGKYYVLTSDSSFFIWIKSNLYSIFSSKKECIFLKEVKYAWYCVLSLYNQISYEIVRHMSTDIDCIHGTH